LGLAVAEKPPFWFEEKIPEDSVWYRAAINSCEEWPIACCWKEWRRTRRCGCIWINLWCKKVPYIIQCKMALVLLYILVMLCLHGVNFTALFFPILTYYVICNFLCLFVNLQFVDLMTMTG
jgi:hypothetical protein